MIRKPISRTAEVFYMAISIVAIVGAYSFMSYRQHLTNELDTTIPNLRQFIVGWEKLIGADSAGNYWLIKDSMATGQRLFLGLLAGVITSFFIGVGMGVHPPIEFLFKIPISILGKIPATAMLAVYFVLFGTETKMYVAMIAGGITPGLTMAIYRATRTDVTDHAIYKAYTLGASSYEVIWEVVVKQILPRIIDSVSLCVGPALVFLIAAEWNTADVGFGYRLRIQSRLLNMNVVYTYLMVLGCFGFFVEWGFNLLRQKWCPWFDLDRN